MNAAQGLLLAVLAAVFTHLGIACSSRNSSDMGNAGLIAVLLAVFVVGTGGVITTTEFLARPGSFVVLTMPWLWATVLFAGFAEVLVCGTREGRQGTPKPRGMTAHWPACLGCGGRSISKGGRCTGQRT